MELMTSRWTDDRMDEGFTEIRNELREGRKEMEARFDKIDGRFDKVDERFETINDRFDRTQEMVIGLHATLTRFSLGFLGAAIVAVIAALVAS